MPPADEIARVIGDVVASMKDASLSAQKLLVLQPVTPDRKPAGRTLVALDAVGAGQPVVGVQEHHPLHVVRLRCVQFREAAIAGRRNAKPPARDHREPGVRDRPDDRGRCVRRSVVNHNDAPHVGLRQRAHDRLANMGGAVPHRNNYAYAHGGPHRTRPRGCHAALSQNRRNRVRCRHSRKAHASGAGFGNHRTAALDVGVNDDAAASFLNPINQDRRTTSVSGALRDISTSIFI